MNRLTVVITAAALAACTHNKPPVGPVAAIEAPAASPQPGPASTGAASPGLHVSQELVRACALHFDRVQAPTFDFDHAALQPADRDVLAQIATCLTTGPLQGRAVQLVGRADPRGTEEYNLGLGTRRAGSVRDYLEHLGVADRQLTEATRGALDATGTDGAGWALDRRVDLELLST